MPDLVTELLEYNKINNYDIDLIDSKQPPYGSIYNLKFLKSKTLKIYIEKNLTIGFIMPFKSFADTAIFIIWKPDGSLRPYVNFWDVNNLTINNQYLLSLIGKFLDWLSRAKRFTKLDLISTYYFIRIREENK